MNATTSNKSLLFIATILGILCTWAIFSYSIDNLDGLGLSPDVKKARTIEIIVFVFGEVFLALAIGRVHKTHPEWATKLAAVWLILLVIDFWGSYQARNAISLHQTLTQSAQKEHAGLIAKQLEVNQTAAKELSDSSARQRANKMVTGSAQTAMQAAKQADNGMELVNKHAEAIKNIKPTEADTFGAWNGTVIFLAVFALYALNTLMWAFIGDFSNSVIAPVTRNDSVTPAPVTRNDSVTPAPVTRNDSVTPAPVTRNDSVTPTPAQPSDSASLEKAKDAIKRSSMPWKVSPFVIAAPLAAVAPMATAAQAPEPPPTPAQPSDSVTPEAEAPEPAAKPKKARAKKLEEVETIQYDTATTGAASHRYQRIRQMVKDKKVKPYVTHIAAIKNEALNTYRAKKYLQAMVNDGLLHWDADKERFRLIETDHRQIELGGL